MQTGPLSSRRGRALKPPQLGTHLESPDAKVEVAHVRRRVGGHSSPRLEVALRADEAAPPQRHGDEDRLLGELDFAHPGTGERQKAAECSSDADRTVLCSVV